MIEVRINFIMSQKVSKQISINSRLGLRQLSSSFTKIDRAQSNKVDSSIIEALNKFSTLNNQYHLQFEPGHLFSTEDNPQFFRKRNGKVDNFTIMAQLRHLQNMASLSNAEHEKFERQHRRHRMGHNMYRKKKNWKKIENNLNTPYLTVYNNWAKEKQEQEEEFFSRNLREQEESQQDQNLNQEELSQKVFKFTKELKPYKKIIQFTKSRIQFKEEYKSKSPASRRRIQSLDQFQLAQKSKSFYQQYNQIARKYEETKQKQRLKSEGIVPTEKIIQKNMSRIFKKASNKEQIEELMNHERFSKLVQKQAEIIENSTKLHHKKQSVKQVKGKFTQILIQMNKGVKKRKFDGRISQSLQLNKKKVAASQAFQFIKK